MENGPVDVTKARKDAVSRLFEASSAAEQSKEHLIREYDEQVRIYEQDCEVLKFQGPNYVSEALDKYLHHSRETAYVMDMCAGTGYVGEILKNLGYKHVDYMDGSSGMLKVALPKGLYNNYLKQIILEDGPTIMRSDIYDGATMSGGHVSPGKINEMLRVVKPGGYAIMAIVLTTDNDKTEAKEVLEHLQELEARNVCKIQEIQEKEKMYLEWEGHDIRGKVVILRKQ